MSVSAMLAMSVLVGSGVGQASSPADSLHDPNIVGTTVGMDGTVITWGLAYARMLEIPTPRTLMLATQIELPMTQPDLGDWRWRVGARVDTLRWGRFAWPVEVDFIVRRLTNRSVRATGLGTQVITMPGWYPKRWFIASEIAWDQQWTTKLVHSEAYRDNVYAEVRDGWYARTGLTMRYGARVGGRPWRHMELWLRAGYEGHGRYDTLVPPVYALAGVNFRF